MDASDSFEALRGLQMITAGNKPISEGHRVPEGRREGETSSGCITGKG